VNGNARCTSARRSALTVLLLVAVIAPWSARAAGDGAAAPASPASGRTTGGGPAERLPAPATARFFNRDIVTFRVPYFGVLPVERATQTAQRIRDALGKGGSGVVKMLKGPEGLTVTVDGAYVFRILEGDLDAEDGQTFDQAEIIVGGRLQDAIGAARSSVRGRELLRAVVLAVAATVAFCLAMWAVAGGRRWTRWRLDAVLVRRAHLAQEERTAVFRVVRALGRGLFVVVGAVLIEEWLRFVFGLFPYTRPWAEHLTGYVAGLLGQVSDAIVDAVPGLVMVLIIAALAHLVGRVLRMFANAIEAGRYSVPGLDAEVVNPARRLATGAVWLFALAMAYPYLPGSSSDAFKGLSVLVGLMLSLGASGLVTQAAGGFILTFGRTLRRDDWVRIGDVEGAVVGVGAFSTRVRTPTDEEVTIPNAVVLTSVTRNYSRPAAAETSMLETSVTIGYNAPWRQVHAMLLEAAARTDLLEREPAPQVFQTALSDFYVQYSLRVRLRDRSRRPEALSTLNGNVQDVFNKYGVQIMSPHYVLDPAAAVLVPKERWFDPPAARLGDGPRGTVEPPPTG